MLAITFEPSLLDTWMKDSPHLPGLLLTAACVGILIAIGLYHFFSKVKDAGRPVLDPVQVDELVTGIGALVVDLRDLNAFRSGHIRGSLHVPFQDLDARFNHTNPGARRAMILVGSSDDMARKAYDQLTAHGFTLLYILKGGIPAWRKMSLPLSK